ncbi:hypothetical protein L842_5452 [Mycobacterium intracellulare MIN_052511_1280]|nr:hypothetical protein L842_5452 [Mycobacterium intracellulare MIN_052511_1280]
MVLGAMLEAGRAQTASMSAMPRRRNQSVNVTWVRRHMA